MLLVVILVNVGQKNHNLQLVILLPWYMATNNPWMPKQLLKVEQQEKSTSIIQVNGRKCTIMSKNWLKNMDVYHLYQSCFGFVRVILLVCCAVVVNPYLPVILNCTDDWFVCAAFCLHWQIQWNTFVWILIFKYFWRRATRLIILLRKRLDLLVERRPTNHNLWMNCKRN